MFTALNAVLGIQQVFNTCQGSKGNLATKMPNWMYSLKRLFPMAPKGLSVPLAYPSKWPFPEGHPHVLQTSATQERSNSVNHSPTGSHWLNLNRTQCCRPMMLATMEVAPTALKPGILLAYPPALDSLNISFKMSQNER